MSFLNSVLSSIETGEVSFTPPPPRKSTTPDSTSSGPKPSLNSKLAATTISGNNGYSGTAQKRKAGEDLPRPAPRSERLPKSLPERFTSSQSSTPAPRSPRDNDVVRKPGYKTASSKPSVSKPAPPKPSAAAVPSKPPPKGSYAAMMAQAKALQTKAPASVGLIRHQAVAKDKKSKVQQKRMTEEAKHKEPAARKFSADRPGAAAAPPRSTKEAILKARQAEVSKQDTYKGTARPRPGSQLPTKSSEPAYTGTSGLPPRRTPGKDRLYGRNRSRSAARNEYLATDEEDEGEYGYEDEDEDQYSDDSDMEAGFLDVEQEEQAALRIAKREDEEELRLEMAAKKEKMERKMKLNALAKSRR
ncbi:hypothetical protein FQN49_003184 [Arthroderma sp. PD_2]|nr:hypothetical protein FQN49_003184 [Arthroderma sp. PD_2]